MHTVQHKAAVRLERLQHQRAWNIIKLEHQQAAKVAAEGKPQAVSSAGCTVADTLDHFQTMAPVGGSEGGKEGKGGQQQQQRQGLHQGRPGVILDEMHLVKVSMRQRANRHK